MKHKKAQRAYEGFGTFALWAFIIAIGLLLLLILMKATGFGQETFSKIYDAIPFI